MYIYIYISFASLGPGGQISKKDSTCQLSSYVERIAL